MTGGFTNASGWRGPAAEKNEEGSDMDGCAAALLVCFLVLVFACGLLLGMVVS